MTTVPAKHLFTVAEYEQMGEAGIFGENHRLELIEGEIIEMSPIGRRHAAIVRILNNVLTRLLGADEAVVDAQNPVVLSEISEPQPDIVLLKPRPDLYADGHPSPEDVLLVIEVADSSLAFDRNVKAPLFARCGIPEVWIVDVNGAAVEVCRDPSAEGYARVERLAEPEESLTPELLPSLRLSVGRLLV